jgi:uncharacterized protein (DUF4213/DUF364 family)
MSLTAAVRATIPRGALEAPLERVAIYPYFTVVVSRRMGLSMTLLDGSAVADQAPREVRFGGAIEDQPLSLVLTWTESDHPLERSIGVAALNSCLPLEGTYHDANALELAASLGAGKNVVVVGHFPRLDPLRKAARSFAILEKKPLPGDLPADAAPEVIPRADLIAATGATFANGTLADLLALKRPGAVFLVLGPTIPLSPVLFDHGVDIVGGAWVEDPRRVERLLRHGGMPRRSSGMRSVVMARSPELLAAYPLVHPPKAP